MARLVEKEADEMKVKIVKEHWHPVAEFFEPHLYKAIYEIDGNRVVIIKYKGEESQVWGY